MKSTTITQNRSRTPCGLLAMMSLMALGACVDAPTPKKTSSQLDASASPGAKFSPSRAAATVALEQRSFEGVAKGTVPSLTLTLNNASYATVHRCSASYKLVYGNGRQELASLPKTDPEYAMHAKDAYGRIGTEGSSCESISPEAATPQVNDYGARTGRFYYVINPCVSKDKSSSGQAGCSYDLQITQVIDYTNTRAKAEVEILSGLYNAEGELYSIFQNMNQTIRIANESLAVCTLGEAQRQAAQRHLAGFVSIVSAVGGALLNLIPGVGTILSTAVNLITGVITQQRPTIPAGCPDAEMEFQKYDELQAQLGDAASRLLQNRQKLYELDKQYADVSKELDALKSSMAK